MSITKYFRRMQYIDFLVRRMATGNTEIFAKKNNLSRSGLAIVIKEMKAMGFPIKYNKNRQTYFYARDGKMVQNLFIDDDQILSREELKEFLIIDTNELCFSEVSIFEPCKKK